MTRLEILAMPAGRELDILVAEKCLGFQLKKVFNLWQIVSGKADGKEIYEHAPFYSADNAAWVLAVEPVPFYSTDMNAAWVLAVKYNIKIDARVLQTPQAAALAICQNALIGALGL